MAAFFAASNSRSSRSGDISIWCLDTIETQNILNKDVQIVEPFDFTNKRMLSQRGCFTRNETNRPHMDELFLEENRRFFRQPEFPFLVQFNLPATEAGLIIDDLMLMGIDFLSVYPDQDGMRESIKHEVLVRLLG